MKTLFTLLICTFLASVLYAQTNFTDVIYLKNGNVYRGFIIEEVPNKSYKIKTKDNNIFECLIDEIEKLTREPISNKEMGVTSGHLQTGYKRIVELGHEFRTNTRHINRLKLNLINAYQINPFVSLGVGTGLRYYYGHEGILVPIFADFRTNFMNTPTSPYLGLGFGYSFDVSYGIRGAGVLFSPTAGVSFKAFNNAQMNLGVGFEMQRVNGWYTTNAVSVNLGIAF
jgi:hypothetical protein